MDMTYEEMVAMLKEGVFNVTFTKVDGTERQMRCTLASENIPAPAAKSGSTRAPNYTVIPVFDMDKADWRSFRVNSVISIDRVA